jgi:Zn-dependent protease with chaperone function
MFTAHVNNVRSQMGFRYLNPGENRQLSNIVETLALTCGIQTPKIGIIETNARNAFACGLHANNAVVVVTRGLLDALTRDELEAVIAHEITHIVNGDIRLIAAANVMMSCLEFANKKNPFVMRSWWRFLFVPIMPAIFIFSEVMKRASGFALDLGKVSRLVIASSREYIADAEAVRLTHKPEALISALRRIENLSTIDGLAPENDAMMIDGATMGSYATHPTIAERIAVLAKLAGVSVASGIKVEEVSAPVEFGKIPAFSPKVSVWRRLNRYLDGVDAKEAAKEAARPKSLFERVKAEKPVNKIEAVVNMVRPWLPVAFLCYLGLISFTNLVPLGRSEVATRQADGTYVRKGVQLSAAEYQKMKRDMKFTPVSILDNAPSKLRQEPSQNATTPNGLRGRSFEEDEGAL